MSQLILKTKNNSKLFLLINEALEYKSTMILLGINRIKNELKEHEKKFNISSSEFYEKYQSGKMGDSLEIIDWAGKFELLRDLKEERQTLKETKVCI